MTEIFLIGCCVVAAISLVFALLCLMGKEFFLSEVYTRASKEQRETMDKKAFRQQAVVIYFTIFLINLISVLRILLHEDLFYYVAMILTFFALVYLFLSERTFKKMYRKDSSSST